MEVEDGGWRIENGGSREAAYIRASAASSILNPRSSILGVV
jgi:hypothetical protein